MELDEAKVLYIQYSKAKGFSAKTWVEWGYHINYFLAYLREKKIDRISRVNRKEIAGYIQTRYYYLNKSGKQNSIYSRNKEISAIKKWFAYLNKAEVISEDPSVTISRLKEPAQKLPKDILSKTEFKKIILTTRNQGIKGQIAELCFEILYAAGMRRQELVNLKISDIDLENQTIFIRESKCGKDRMIPINRTSVRHIQNYLIEIRPQLTQAKHTDYLLVGTLVPKMNKMVLYDLLSSFIQKAQLKKKISPHSFRNTAATHLLLAGMPARHVQSFLGHENLETTARYLQISIKDLEKEYRKFHPCERSLDI